MTWRKPAFVVEPQAPFEFRLAAFADANQRVVFYDPERLAPNFKPVSGAAFVRIEHRNAARVLERQDSQRQNNKDTRDRRYNNASPAACERHHNHGNAQSRQRCSRRSEYQRYRKQRDRHAQKYRRAGSLIGDRYQHPDRECGYEL